jgi:pimeloyl-ACP methyl ester carboxylesterase
MPASSPPTARVWFAPVAALLLLAACSAGASQEEKEADRFPTSKDFSTDVMRRAAFTAGGETPWRLSALETPRANPASWRIVVVTGTPSWSEYWAPTLAKIGPDREMIVADRPGFAESEPNAAVTSIEAQAEALEPMLGDIDGQKVILIGQSYGGPIATVLAARRPDKVKALVLMSAFFGDRGPTIRRLSALGSLVRPALPRDMKNALAEIDQQKPQLPQARAALGSLAIPVIVLHGDRDTFITPADARRLAVAAGPRAEFMNAPGGDHFLNACCVDSVLGAVERGVAAAESGT